MLVLSRKVGEEIVIGDNIRVKVLSVRGNQIRLGFTAPDNVVIHREELCRPAPKATDKPAPSSSNPVGSLPAPDAVITTPSN
jgi:carbon storage regulator